MDKDDFFWGIISFFDPFSFLHKHNRNSQHLLLLGLISLANLLFGGDIGVTLVGLGFVLFQILIILVFPDIDEFWWFKLISFIVRVVYVLVVLALIFEVSNHLLYEILSSFSL